MSTLKEILFAQLSRVAGLAAPESDAVAEALVAPESLELPSSSARAEIPLPAETEAFAVTVPTTDGVFFKPITRRPILGIGGTSRPTPTSTGNPSPIDAVTEPVAVNCLSKVGYESKVDERPTPIFVPSYHTHLES